MNFNSILIESFDMFEFESFVNSFLERNIQISSVLNILLNFKDKNGNGYLINDLLMRNLKVLSKAVVFLRFDDVKLLLNFVDQNGNYLSVADVINSDVLHEYSYFRYGNDIRIFEILLNFKEKFKNIGFSKYDLFKISYSFFKNIKISCKDEFDMFLNFKDYNGDCFNKNEILSFYFSNYDNKNTSIFQKYIAKHISSM
jgi:hypothetical protein